MYVIDDMLFGDVVTGGLGAMGDGGATIVSNAIDWSIVSGYTVDGDRLKVSEIWRVTI